VARDLPNPLAVRFVPTIPTSDDDDDDDEIHLHPDLASDDNLTDLNIVDKGTKRSSYSDELGLAVPSFRSFPNFSGRRLGKPNIT
jgi:hypothetical protein